MISHRQRTVALSTVAVAAVVAVFAFAPIVADMMQAHAFSGRFGGGFGHFGRFGGGFGHFGRFGGGWWGGGWPWWGGGGWWGGGCGCGCC